ncbi:MAG: tRNA (adenosine(37)-N6)-dimethylallyltransferase MiaA [Tenericutes bacterium]|nr:tRNA (adenosine(37)-N6)-dimethylallyltransferase MiaA [Mycoplasmatota bacterium]
MIIVIVGPTGVGKTKLSIELAKRYNAEIINADSMQVYRGLDIATAKIKETEKENIPHHLFDISDVDDIYTVYDYQRDCRAKINEILNKNKNVIIVGGTGLYIKAALYDYQFKTEYDLNDYADLTNEEIFDRIKKYDNCCDIHINNRKRLVRLLNKYENNLITEKNGNSPLYDFILIGLTTDRKTLYEKINSRVDIMVEEGLIEEAKSLYDKHIYTKAIQTAIGYKELYPYFDNKCSLEDSLELIKKNSRHYAKRQYTFFNNQFDNINWIETNYDDFSKTISQAITVIDNK